jgi:hypothetical protein
LPFPGWALTGDFRPIPELAPTSQSTRGRFEPESFDFI